MYIYVYVYVYVCAASLREILWCIIPSHFEIPAFHFYFFFKSDYGCKIKTKYFNPILNFV